MELQDLERMGEAFWAMVSVSKPFWTEVQREDSRASRGGVGARSAALFADCKFDAAEEGFISISVLTTRYCTRDETNSSTGGSQDGH